MLNAEEQMNLLNMGSKITRLGTGKKPFNIGQALRMFKNLGVK